MTKEANRLAVEQRLRKTVYNAIVVLSECVNETTLQKMVFISYLSLFYRFLHAKIHYIHIMYLFILLSIKTLILQLNSLDQNSWMEVIEERYLSRLCAFPLCTNPVEVKNSQKYRIDLKNKKVG